MVNTNHASVAICYFNVHLAADSNLEGRWEMVLCKIRIFFSPTIAILKLASGQGISLNTLVLINFLYKVYIPYSIIWDSEVLINFLLRLMN